MKMKVYDTDKIEIHRFYGGPERGICYSIVLKDEGERTSVEIDRDETIVILFQVLKSLLGVD